ncbi:hypothetical protein QYF61_019542 [Mycteria americana]|uniref:Reverse transcriptase n=1 Tax=Mycteria americana TaxID=33587 RepID=A0AAN7P6V4_MYCAM|nr:hypothetical protein QYF61_019542 [Mycteria americana]
MLPESSQPPHKTVVMKFSKGKCKALHLGRNNPMHDYMLGATQVENSIAKRDLGVLVDTKLNMTQQCAPMAKKAKGILACIRQIITSRSREAIFPLYSALVGPYLESCVQFWAPIMLYKLSMMPYVKTSTAPQYNRDMDMLGRVQQWATKMIKGLEHLSYKERLRELGLFSLEKRRLGRDLIVVYKYLKGETRVNRHKVKHKRFPLNIRKHFFTVRVTKHWHRLPREVVESPSSEIFKSHLDMDNIICNYDQLRKKHGRQLPLLLL